MVHSIHMRSGKNACKLKKYRLDSTATSTMSEKVLLANSYWERKHGLLGCREVCFSFINNGYQIIMSAPNSLAPSMPMPPHHKLGLEDHSCFEVFWIDDLPRRSQRFCDCLSDSSTQAEE